MKWYKTMGVIAFFMASLTGCTSSGVNETMEEKPVPVTIAKVELTDMIKTASIVGRVKPSSSVDVFAKTPGTVRRVWVEVGDVVKKGDLLFELDDADVLLQLDQAKAGLAIAQANLDRVQGGSMELQNAQLLSSLSVAELNLRDAKSAYETTAQLYQNSGVTREAYEAVQTRYQSSKEQFENAKKALELTQGKIHEENTAQARAQRDQARAAFEMAQKTLSHLKVTAPMDGVVAIRNVEVGGMTNMGVLSMNIVDIEKVVVDIQVLEDALTKINPGDVFDVFIASVGEEPFKAEVVNVSPNVDARTNSYLVRLSLENQDGQFKGGMLATVEVWMDRRKDVYAVPIDAVVDEGGEKVIYVINGERAEKRVVTLGLFEDKKVEVAGQLSQDEKVIVKGQTFLSENSKIIVVE
jgi:HlyD family secretion protein